MSDQTPQARWRIVAGGALGGVFAQAIGLGWSAMAEHGVLFLNDSTAPIPIQNDVAFVHVALFFAHFVVGAILSWPLAVYPTRRAARIAFVFSAGVIGAFVVRDLGRHPGLYLEGGLSPDSVWNWALEYLKEYPDYALTLALPVAAIVALRLAHDRSFGGLTVMFVFLLGLGWVMTAPPDEPTPAEPAATGKPDILVVIMSSLDTTNLESATQIDARFAEWLDASVVFEEAYVPAAAISPAVESILTGALPWEQPLRGSVVVGRSAPREGSLAAALRAVGYSTTLVADRAGEALARSPFGFERVRAPMWTMRRAGRIRALLATKTALPVWSALAERGLTTPTFSLAAGPDPTMVVDETLRLLARPVYEPRMTVVYIGRPALDAFFFPPDEDAADNALAQVARLVDAVGSTPKGSETIIALTAIRSDEDMSGERMQHASELRVPIVIHAPSRLPAGARNFDLVSVADIAPTLATLVGAPADRHWNGLDLTRVARGEIPGRTHLVFGTSIWRNADAGGLGKDERVSYPDAKEMMRWDGLDGPAVFLDRFVDVIEIARHRAIFDGRYKLIAMPTPKGVVYELFDVLYDPDETNNIAAKFSSTTRKLREELQTEIVKAGRHEISRGYVLPASAPLAP